MEIEPVVILAAASLFFNVLLWMLVLSQWSQHSVVHAGITAELDLLKERFAIFREDHKRYTDEEIGSWKLQSEFNQAVAADIRFLEGEPDET